MEMKRREVAAGSGSLCLLMSLRQWLVSVGGFEKSRTVIADGAFSLIPHNRRQDITDKNSKP